jgi:type IV pilus assembly protein PilW
VRQRRLGMTVIELLVAMAIGLVLIAGLGSMVVGSRQSSRAERNLTEVQTTGRVGLDLIARELRKAGYRIDREQDPADLFPAGGAPFEQAGAVVARAIEGAGFTIRYQGTGDTWTTDCLGNPVGAGQVVWESLWLQQGTLRCRARNLGLGTDTTEVLIPQLEDLAIAFGVDSNGDGQADLYQPAPAVVDWSRIASVKVRLRVVSAEDGLADAPQPYLDAGDALRTPADRRLRRTFTTVTALRNVLP